MSNTSPSPFPPPASGTRGRWGLVSALLALVAIGLVAGSWYVFHDRPSAASASPPRVPPPPDPRMTYAGPYLNIAPDVRYVGSASCTVAGCHDSQAASYPHHPMGRSLISAGQVEPAPPEDQRHNNPFAILDSQFRVEHAGPNVRHHRTIVDEQGRPIADSALLAAYAIGSGSHGHSYLSVLDGGYVVQTPISWYSQKQTWDLSPAFDDPTHRAWLSAGRPVMPDCLYCHANHAEPVDGALNRYREPVFDGLAIGCERCHGPGEKHVAARRNKEPVSGNIDYTIVNPDHLKPALREAVCEQCHLAGEARVLRRGRQLYDYRPGLPLRDFLTIFVRASEGARDNKAVNHVLQMHASRCYGESSGDNKLGCVSCHDPHVHVLEPQARVRHYRESCLACHQQHGCTLPREERAKTSREDSCIDCHMPRHAIGNIAHTAATDHRILRAYRAEDEPRAAPLPTGTRIPVVTFYPSTGTPAPDDERDLGVALMGPLTASGKLAATSYSGPALQMLESAVSRDPQDWEAAEARANALWAQGRPGDALAAFEAVVAATPSREAAVVGAAGLAQVLNQDDRAAGHWRRAIELNPWIPAYRQALCQLLAQNGRWDELRPECEAWLRLDPASVDGRQTLVTCLLRTGRKQDARAEFEKLQALHPANLAKLRAWFSEESK
jgi:Tfp pilus assembly protein PilF